MSQILFNAFDRWDADEDLEFLRAMAEEIDAEEAEEHVNNERVPRTRRYIHRDREQAGEMLHKHYFCESPKFHDRHVKRRFRMSKDLFLCIINDIIAYDVQPLPRHFEYFKPKIDALGRKSFSTIQKCTSALRQLAYGTAADMFDEYLQMSECTSIVCLDMFCRCVLELYVDEYLRKPTSSDIARLYSAHEEKHGFKGMLGSIDCMYWQWRNCPVAWKGQYTSGHQKHPTIVLEAVASYDTWIWHAFFGDAGANNDVNVLNQSSLFDDIKNGTAPFAPFTVNGNTYTNGYYLVDGIYPDWATLIKAYLTPTEEPRIKFKRFQESARKDVERTFGVLQGRFHILQMAGRPQSVNKLRRILYCCVLLHNMIVEDNGFNISWLEEELLNTREANPNFVRNRSTSRDVRDQEIRDRNIHDQLREDLTQHIWELPPNFRTLNA
ncbi:protein ALP1-like [Rutidosis leptorrhynchoides]|uniref:protein ALP1-like n=1 Tax=Rutidosis leptorrhynchoides TaxID=125765 RepID=UPI003A9A5E36